MTYGYATEKCPCGASIKIPVLSTGHEGVWGDSMAQLKEWRETHRHEFPPEPEMPPEPPTISESGSSHERLGDEFPIQERALIGFQRNL